MKSQQNLKKINNKTLATFITTFIISLLLIFSFVLFSHIIKKIYFINMVNYLLNKTALIFFKNLLTITIIALIFNYAVIIKKSDQLTAGNQTISYSKIISTGMYIIIILTIIYFFGSEFMNPYSHTKIEWLEKNTNLSKFLIEKGNESYIKQDYKNSLYYYNQYSQIISNNDKIERRIREMELKIGINNFDHNSNNTNNQSNIKEDMQNSNIASVIKDPFQLAEIYYDKKLFLSAWYYYEYVVESDSSRRNYARQKIKEIRELLNDRNKLNTNTISSKFLTDKEKEIRNIYRLKKQAEWYENNNYVQKAYFTYLDILKINPNLRDVVEYRDRVFKKLSDISVELSDAKKVLEYKDSGRLLFFSLPTELIFIKKVIKRLDVFYFYDITIYNLDKNFNLISTVSAPYGVSKSDKSFTLYCYSLTNRSIEYFPTVKDYTTNKTYKSSNYFYRTPISIDILQNFTNNYEETLSYPIVDLFRLKNIVLNNRLSVFRKQWAISFFEKNILQEVNSEDRAKLLSLYKKNLNMNSYIQNEVINKNNKKEVVHIFNKLFPNFTIGFNYALIKTAILDKISRIFLFLSFSLFMLGFTWRYKAGYISSIPKLHIMLFVVIPIAIFILIKILYSLIIIFYSILVSALNFNIVMIICFVLNIAILLFCIFYLAGTKSS